MKKESKISRVYKEFDTKYAGKTEEEINKEIENLEKEIKELFDNGKLDKNNIKIFKPMPAPIDKIQNRFRYRIIIKAKMTEEINEILNKYLKKVYQKDTKSVRISIDVNPNNMS